jgi:hypothetical protein
MLVYYNGRQTDNVPFQNFQLIERGGQENAAESLLERSAKLYSRKPQVAGVIQDTGADWKTWWQSSVSMLG